MPERPKVLSLPVARSPFRHCVRRTRTGTARATEPPTLPHCRGAASCHLHGEGGLPLDDVRTVGADLVMHARGPSRSLHHRAGACVPASTRLCAWDVTMRNPRRTVSVCTTCAPPHRPRPQLSPSPAPCPAAAKASRLNSIRPPTQPHRSPAACTAACTPASGVRATAGLHAAPHAAPELHNRAAACDGWERFRQLHESTRTGQRRGAADARAPQLRVSQLGVAGPSLSLALSRPPPLTHAVTRAGGWVAERRAGLGGSGATGGSVCGAGANQGVQRGGAEEDVSQARVAAAPGQKPGQQAGGGSVPRGVCSMVLSAHRGFIPATVDGGAGTKGALPEVL
jgi:hypothetical protein